MRYSSEHPDECKDLVRLRRKATADFGPRALLNREDLKCHEGADAVQDSGRVQGALRRTFIEFRPLMDSGRKEEKEGGADAKSPQYFPGGIPNMPSQFEQRSDSPYQREYRKHSPAAATSSTRGQAVYTATLQNRLLRIWKAPPQSRINSASLTASMA